MNPGCPIKPAHCKTCAEYESAMRNLVASSEGSRHLQSRTAQYRYLPCHSGCDRPKQARTRHVTRWPSLVRACNRSAALHRSRFAPMCSANERQPNVRPHIVLNDSTTLFVLTREIAPYSQDPGSSLLKKSPKDAT